MIIIYLGLTPDQVANVLWDTKHVLTLSTSLTEIKPLKNEGDCEVISHSHKSPGKHSTILFENYYNNNIQHLVFLKEIIYFVEE